MYCIHIPDVKYVTNILQLHFAFVIIMSNMTLPKFAVPQHFLLLIKSHILPVCRVTELTNAQEFEAIKKLHWGKK